MTWRWSYAAIPAALAITGFLHLGVLLLAILFSYLTLNALSLVTWRRKWAALTLFLVLTAALLYGLGYFIHEAVVELPDIIDNSVPAIAEWARQHHITLPFTDYDSLKDLAVTTAKSEVRYIGDAARLARETGAQMVLLMAGVVIAMAKFMHHAAPEQGRAGTLNDLACREIVERFRVFYECFATIMGAQVTISVINTVLVAIYVVVMGLPHAVVIIGVTLICGLLPVIGNLISNAIMVCIAFTVSPREALIALVFLVVVHKLEYFLNSRIIGGRISQPIWLTLLALVLGEKLMGVTGMILAPVLLFYLRSEAARISVKEA